MLARCFPYHILYYIIFYIRSLHCVVNPCCQSVTYFVLVSLLFSVCVFKPVKYHHTVRVVGQNLKTMEMLKGLIQIKIFSGSTTRTDNVKFFQNYLPFCQNSAYIYIITLPVYVYTPVFIIQTKTYRHIMKSYIQHHYVLFL